jgi:hypothetical protein
MNRVNLAQDREMRWAIVYMDMNAQVPEGSG